MATRRDLEQTSFLYGGNGAFLEELYARYLTEPSAIDPSWRAHFDDLGPENRTLFERSRAAQRPRPRELGRCAAREARHVREGVRTPARTLGGTQTARDALRNQACFSNSVTT